MEQGNYYMEESPNQSGEFETRKLKGVNSAPSSPAWENPKFQTTFNPMETAQEAPSRINYGDFREDKSRYDEHITDLSKLEEGYSMNNLRGELQSGIVQFGSGLAKGTVLALTTMVDSVLGTIVGIGNAAATGTFSGFWDNPVSNFLERVNRWSETALPNYYTKEEEEQPWYKNIWTANFLGDKVLKNLGFAVGAAYGGIPAARGTAALLRLNKARQAFKGAVTASGKALDVNQVIQAYKSGDKVLDGIQLTEQLISDAKKLKHAEPVLKLTGAISGALGEGRLEAISNTVDWADRATMLLNDNFSKVVQGEREALMQEFPEFVEYEKSPDGKYMNKVLSPEGEALAQQRAKAKFDYEGGLAKIEDGRVKMGNTIFLANLPLLTFGDVWQAGKIYAGGFKMAKKGGNILRTVAGDGTISYSVAKRPLVSKVGKVASTGIVEGLEEGNQSVISISAGTKQSANLNDFYGAKIDPEAEAETISVMQALGKGIADTYGTAEGWEQVAIGALTGFMGIPGFRKFKSSEGKIQSPIYLQGGMKEAVKEMKEERLRDEELVNQLNERVQSPEFLNYYQSAIRHNKYQKDMDDAAAKDDSFEFKNAEHNQLINDVIMFGKAGRINDLYDLIEETGTIKPEDVDQIRQLTTNQETGTSVYDGMTDTEVIDQIKKQAESMKKSVDRYREISDALQVKIGDVFEGDELEEMTYLFSNIDNLESRFKEVFQGIKQTLTPAINELGEEAMFKRGEEEVKASDLLQMNPEQLLSEFANNKEELEKLFNTIPDRANLKNKELQEKYKEALNKYAESPTRGRKGNITKVLNKVAALQKEVDRLTKEGIIVDGENLSNQLMDLVRIADKRLDFIDKYIGYTTNPQALRDKQAGQREEVLDNHTKQQTSGLRDKLSNSNNFREFKDAFEEEQDAEISQKVLDDLIKEDNKLAKSFKESQSYSAQVIKAIGEQEASEEGKNRAIDIFNHIYNEGKSLEDISNPDSDLINPALLYDEALDDRQNLVNFSEAQYILQSAMNKVNNSNQFKDRFPKEYLKPVKKVDNVRTPMTKTETGADAVAVSVPANQSSVKATEAPVGDITAEEVLEENKEANGEVLTPKAHDSKSKGRRQYYRPSIPELHIEASKEGDFRPFNIVAKEKNNKVNFDALYDYLKNSRAFEYVNEGNLKPGDELGFMIDPGFNDHTIFIIDKMNNQIVGSLDESEYSVDRYEGLSELIKKIKDEYANRTETPESSKEVYNYKVNVLSLIGFIEETRRNNRKEYEKMPQEVLELIRRNVSDGKLDTLYYDKLKSLAKGTFLEGALETHITPVYKEVEKGAPDKFIATPTTRVSQIMVGRIPYGNEERSVNDIPGVSGDSVFGIVKNGFLSTNGKLEDDKVVKPLNVSDKEGRMYLLIPNGAGKYSPAAVRIKHFNSSEFNPEDVNVRSTTLYKNIRKGIEGLADSLTEDDVKEAVGNLARSLYLGNVHIDFVNNKAGQGIRLTKVQKDSSGREIYEEVGGERIRKEDSRVVYLTDKWDPNVEYELGDEGVITQPERKPVNEVADEIQKVLMAFNLPLQVNLGMLNKGGYNDMLLSSGALTSNISEAKVKSSWFTTDYFDVQGNLQQAFNPMSIVSMAGRKVQTPVGGGESAIPGTRIESDNISYHVDLTSNTVRNNNGKIITTYPKEILDLAYIQDNYGSMQNGAMMINGVALLPDGKVMNRSTGKYIEGKKAEEFKQKLAGRKAQVSDSKKVIGQIEENQLKVDKSKTDSEAYYILEEDGNYHSYKRVHQVLGNNWTESPKQTKALQDLRVNLSKYADDIHRFNHYLKNLETHYKVDLSSFRGKNDARSRDSIVNIVRDSMLGTNSQRALNAGSAVDSVIRDFFISKEMPVKPDNMSSEAFNSLIDSLVEIKGNIESKGETFLTNNIVLFHKYETGERIAGEVDILAMDADGNFKIYDIKTSRYSFHDFTDKYGRKVNYFQNKSTFQTMSQKQYYTQQLSAYKNLFESQYHVPIVSLAILPFVLGYEGNSISSISKEKGIPIEYNPAVRVPLEGNVDKVEKPVTGTDGALPIFDSSLELHNPVHNVSSEFFMADSGAGYFVIDGVLHRGFLKPLGKIGDTKVYMTKVPNMTKGFGNDKAHVASNSYYAVFPNGNAVRLIENALSSYSDSDAESAIRKALEKNPKRITEESGKQVLPSTQEMSSEERKAPEKPKESEKPVTPASINQSSTGGAKGTVQMETSINQLDDEFEEELVLYKSNDNDFFNDDNFGKNIKKIPGLNIEEGKKYELDTLEKLFDRFVEGDAEQKALADKVFKVARNLGLNIIFDNKFSFGVKGQYSNNNTIRFNHKFFTDDFLNHTKSAILLHEVIHATTMYILSDSMQDRLTGELKIATDAIKEAFQLLKSESSLAGEYGLTNAKEMMAELANPSFRDKTKKIGIWEKIKEAIKKLFFFDVAPASNAYVVLSRALDTALDNFNIDLYNDYNGVVSDSEVGYNPNEWSFYKEVSNEKKALINREVRTWYSRNVFNDYNINMMIDANNDGYILLDQLYTFHYNEHTGEVENIIPIYQNSDYNRNRIDGWIKRFDRRAFGTETISSATITQWETLDKEDLDMLKKKGWTQNKFDSISQAERDQAIKCLHW